MKNKYMYNVELMVGSADLACKIGHKSNKKVE